MREDVLLLLLGAALIFSFLGLLGWALEQRDAASAGHTRVGARGIGFVCCPRKRLHEHRQRRHDPAAREEMLNEKVLRWVNKDVQTRADRRGRTW